MTSITNYIMLKILKMKILANEIRIGERGKITGNG